MPENEHCASENEIFTSSSDILSAGIYLKKNSNSLLLRRNNKQILRINVSEGLWYITRSKLHQAHMKAACIC